MASPSSAGPAASCVRTSGLGPPVQRADTFGNIQLVRSSSPQTRRVLHLVRALHVGGLERVVLNLLEGLAVRGWSCHLGCLVETGRWADQARVEGRWMGDLDRHTRARTVWSLARYLRQHHIALLHTHNSQAHLFGVAAGRLANVPVVHTKHGQNWPDDPRWVWISRQASRWTRYIVAVSEDIARIVRDIERVPVRKVRTIPNGIDLRPFQASPEVRAEWRQQRRRELGFPPDVFVVGSVGRLAWEKHYDLLLLALARALAHTREMRLLLIGEGPERSRLEAQATTLGIVSLCALPGHRDEISSWLCAMDVFCLCSRTEGLSVTLLEAGAAGLPAVVTRVGGNSEIIRHDETGLVVPPGDPEALAEALILLWNRADLRRQYGGAAARRIAQYYGQGLMVERYEALYEQVLH